VLLQTAEQLLTRVVLFTAVHVAQRGVRDRQPVQRIDGVQRLATACDELLVRLDQHRLVVHHRVEVVVLAQEQVLEPAGAAAEAVHLPQDPPHLLLHRGVRQILGAEHLGAASKGRQEAEVGGGAGVRLAGAGHHEAQVADLGGLQDVRHANVGTDPSELLGHGLFDPEHDGRADDALGIGHEVLGVAEVEPQRVGGPDRVVRKPSSPSALAPSRPSMMSTEPR